MVPLNIVLGPKAALCILDNVNNRSKMEQHCLLYTDKMLEKYMDIDEDSAEALIGYIDAHEGEAGFSNRIPDVPGIVEPLEQMIARICPKEEKAFPSNIAILFEDEKGREVKALGNRKSNIVTTKEIEENKRNVFSMLSPDTGSMDVESGDDCCFWSEYFARIIEGEKTITFMDRYGLSPESLLCLKTHYLPFLDKGMKIVLYVSDYGKFLTEEDAKLLITSDADLNKLNIELFLIEEPHTQHERWIQTDNFFIYQGRGICMLSANGRGKISASSTVIVERRNRRLPKAKRIV